jgi:hypothetical protein
MHDVVEIVETIVCGFLTKANCQLRSLPWRHQGASVFAYSIGRTPPASDAMNKLLPQCHDQPRHHPVLS